MDADRRQVIESNDFGLNNDHACEMQGSANSIAGSNSSSFHQSILEKNSKKQQNNRMQVGVSRIQKSDGHWLPIQTLVAGTYDNVSIFFADVVSFTKMSACTSPVGLVQLLNHMFEMYDQLAAVNGVEKIKTIGDCYMAATGMPNENPNHAQALCRFGLNMLAKMKNPRT